ncbi:TVP38/TMEM64 family protein [Lunatibacter salilacus]|uniref:TVP38/TMEM64 family protein n=1 Tax=Lunatibacter salilacus TaxID=2483804 RepID=UPI00131DBF70|nr:VTT domain-containing protein [Lunatibacter salilacus]
MRKKPPIFKKLADIYQENPSFYWAVLWVAIMPSMGSIVSLQILFTGDQDWIYPQLTGIVTVAIFVCLAGFIMGLALLPTTLLSILTGYIWGWDAFGWLVMAYLLATSLGYTLGKFLSQHQLDILLKYYPRAKKMVLEKQEKIGSLIFFVRLSPVIPFAFSNVLFALLKTGLWRVLWWGIWGMLPRTILAFYSGTIAGSLYQALMDNDNYAEWITFIILLAVSIWGIVRFVKKDNKTEA